MSLTLAQLDKGVDALLENSAELVNEADCLLQAGAYARAYALAHLAREEMSRVAMLQAAATRVLANHPIDWKRLMVRLKDHKAKLRLETVESALFLMSLGQEGSGETTMRLAEGIVDHRNDLKNASLYVDFKDGVFVKPHAAITQHQATRTVSLAKMRLDLLQKFRKAIPSYEERKAEHPLSMQPVDPEKVLEALPAAAARYGAVLRFLLADADTRGPSTGSNPLGAEAGDI